MSGEVSIDHGGAISVDPAALRDAAARIAALANHYGEAHRAILRAYDAVTGDATLAEAVDAEELRESGRLVAELSCDCDDAAAGTSLMADVYEYVELQAEADALALVDEVAASELRGRLDRLAAADDRVPDMARMLVSGWEEHRFDGLAAQSVLGAFGPLLAAATLVGARGDRGTVWRWMRLAGEAAPVTVTAVATSSPSKAPTGIADALARLPGKDGAQVAVETYTNADGTRRFVAYIGGTRSPGAGGAEPWDMSSNAQLYTGRRSASYQASLDALAAAGARRGDQVNVVAYSQGGLIGARLAIESGYDVAVQITAGSPVTPMVTDDQTLIQLAHTDDVVRSLAGGGAAGGSGSPESFTATVADEADALIESPLAPHALESYRDLAARVDASGDPRVQSLDGFWSELGQAVSIERTEYRAERSGADGG